MEFCIDFYHYGIDADPNHGFMSESVEDKCDKYWPVCGMSYIAYLNVQSLHRT